MKFVKIDNYWWELEGDLVVNCVGGFHSAKSYNFTEKDIVEVDDWSDLDWNGTSLCSDEYKTGWLDRQGKLYGCDYMAHDRQAEFVHKQSTKELEKTGWIRVYKSSIFESRNENGLQYIILKYRPSEDQIRTLKKLGFSMEEK